MIGTFEAMLIALVAVMPGAAYTWAFEQQAGRWGANFADRVWRFAGVSSMFLVLALPGLYLAYRDLVVSGDVQAGRPVPIAYWLAAALYMAVPWILGRMAGGALRKRRRWVIALTGPAPSPRAWDHLFTTPQLNGWLLLELKDGAWLAGFWGAEDNVGGHSLTSYASGYPELQEFYFSDTAEVDELGAVKVDASGHPVPTGLGLLVRWDEVAYAYFSEG